ncbi:RNA polymerase sigma factor [Aquisphaera insulae]|uniref:RNA polymerase sigma factor n=1 Tax=Aquisphaera insulae TaxID=2712864 RepID=UPI0013EB6400|nr:RNA polymerase sigma factor [Aquisphaera insulae]
MTVDHLDELIERLNDGDITAAERAFLAYEPYLRMAIRRQLTGPLRSKLDSMDIVQSVWADVLLRFRDAGWRFTDRSHLRAFLMRVARNRLIDRRREHHRAIEQEAHLDDEALQDIPAGAEPRPSEVAQGRELWERMLEKCPPEHREILRLKRQGMKLAEISARTGLHEGSIRRILYDLARRLAVPRRTITRPSPDAADPDADADAVAEAGSTEE